MNTPNLDLPQMPQNSLQPSVPYNGAVQLLDVLVQLVLQSAAVTAPPATTAADVGKVWAVGVPGTGVWAGHDSELAVCTAADLWMFAAPKIGWRGYNIAAAADFRYDGAVWAAA